MQLDEAMKRGTPGPWWTESGTAHAKAPNWTDKVHSCVHPIISGNGTEDDSVLAVHWYNHGPKLLEALKECRQELYDSCHSSGDPYDETNMQCDAVVCRDAHNAITAAEEVEGL